MTARSSRLLDRAHAAVYDVLTSALERRWLAATRSSLLEDAHGRVLEVGAGTGANLPHYRRDQVARLDIVEPSPHMAGRLARRTPDWAEVHGAGAEALPFPDGAFDSAVATLVFCTVPDAARGYAELRRVLAPGASFVFVEHVRSPRPRIARWQDRLDGLWGTLCGGCHANRSSVDEMQSAGFEIERLDGLEVDWRGGLVRNFVWGVARST